MLAVENGFYLRQVMERSTVDSNDTILLCQYMTLANNSDFLIEEVTYLNGDGCVQQSAQPLWMQTIRGTFMESKDVSSLTPSISQRNAIQNLRTSPIQMYGKSSFCLLLFFGAVLYQVR